MWNPDTYRDTDFGLDRDESFEPEELEGENREPASGEPYIQTVLGRIAPDDAGLTLMHEHLHREEQAERQDGQLTSEDAALLDLEAFFTVGGRTVVDATTSAAGRSAGSLVWLAQRAPVHIVASTGFHLGPEVNVDEAIRMLERELSGGLDDTSVMPGTVQLTVGEDVASAQAGGVFDVIAAATGSAPLPVVIAAPHGIMRVELIAAAIDRGIAADRLVVVVTQGEHASETLHSVLERGSYLLFNDLGQRAGDTDRATAASVDQLVRDGFQDRILLSHGFTRRSQPTGYEGKPGFGYLVEQFAIMLLEEGVLAQDVRAMLIDNCAAALSVPPSLQAGGA